MTPSLLQNTSGIGIAQVQSHGTAALLAHHFSVNLHKHGSAQGGSQREFLAVSLCCLRPTLTSQESRRASMPLSLAANVLLLWRDHFVELPKVQDQLGIMQTLTTPPRSRSCNGQFRTVRVLKERRWAWETSTYKALQGHWRTGAEILWFPMQSAIQRALRGVLCVFATTGCGMGPGWALQGGQFKGLQLQQPSWTMTHGWLLRCFFGVA